MAATTVPALLVLGPVQAVRAQTSAPTPTQSPAGEKGPGAMGRTVSAPPSANPTVIRDPLVDENGKANAPRSVTATFQVTYDAGFNANASAKAAFQSAVNLWSTRIRSSVPIRVNAKFSDLGGCAMGCTLGQAGFTESFQNFAGAPMANTRYPITLADAIAGTELDSSVFDIEAEFNSNSSVGWYFGVDGNPPNNKTDFKSVIVHELGHGLGFAGSAGFGTASCGSATAGCFETPPLVFDRFTRVKSTNATMLGFTSPSAALGTQLTTPHSVVFSGTNTNAAGGPAQLYTPNPWSDGSSYSHVDTTYDGTPNALMTWSLGQGEVTQDVGPLVLGMFQDMGWKLNSIRPPADFDGNTTTDLSVFRPGSNTWFLKTGAPQALTFGAAGDVAVPADYDGDGKADVAVYRPSNGVWYLNTTPAQSIQWGDVNDIPVPADYDGDGKADLAVFRPSTGVWYLNTSPAQAIAFGQSGDIPVPGDYDGDGKADLAVFRPSTGVWYLNTSPGQSIAFGTPGDIPVPGDYDGDERVDLAVFRPSTNVWYLNTASPQSVLFGATGDVPMPGDYNGDGRVDIALFRPGNNVWYVSSPPSSSGFGQSGDLGLPLPYAIRRAFF